MRPRRRTMRAATCLVALLAAGCAPSGSVVELADVDGARHTPTDVAPGHVHVVVFTSQECPIANAYAPRLGELARQFEGRPVRMFLVHVDPDLSVAQAQQHRDDYALPGTLLFDREHRLAKALGATITPEAVVLHDHGLVYRGRIDDQWRALGVRAPAAGSDDLRLAIEAALRGEAVPLPHPPAVGCLLPEPAK